MAIVWGAWAPSSSTNQRIRLGLDLSYSGNPAYGSVTVTKKLYAQCGYRISDSTNSTVISGVGGSFSGSRNYDFPSSDSVIGPLWTGSTSESLVYGSTTTKTASASVTGIEYIGSSVKASVSASIVLPARPYSVPAAPTNFVNTRLSDTQNKLTWTNNPTTAAPYESLMIARSVDGAASVWIATGLSGTLTSYTDSNTSADHSYSYTIRVVNSAGTSAGTVSNTTYNTPAAPSACSANKDGSDVVVSWQDNSRHETGFQIWESVNGGEYSLHATTAANATSYRRTSVSSSNSYRYKVRAVTHGPLYSAYSNESDLIPAGPASPTNVAVHYVNDSRLEVSWTNNATQQAPYNSIAVQRMDAAQQSVWVTLASSLAGSATSYADTTTSTNKRYRYRVIAYNDAGSATSQSSAWQETTPAAPSACTATWSGNDLVVSWQDNSAYETHFEVWHSEDGGAIYGLLDTTTSRSYTHSAPSKQVPHTYQVRAVGASNEEVYSQFSAPSQIIPAVPTAPKNVTLTRVSDTQTNVAWTNQSSTLAPYASINVERWDNVSASWYAVKTGLAASATSYSDTSTTSNRRYQYRVVAVNVTGTATSAASSYIDTTPAAPSDISAIKVGTDIAVSWKNNATNASAFEVWHSEGGGEFALLATVTTTTYTHASPSSSKTHAYKVRAKATQGVTLYSAFSSQSATVQLLTPPNAPTGLTGGVFDATEPVTVSWTHNPVDTTPQSAFEVRWRVQGSETWESTGEIASSTSAMQFPTDTFTNGTRVEYQVRTKGMHADFSPWSLTQVIVLSARPVVTLTSPEQDEIVQSPTLSVEWLYHDDEGKPQGQYRITLKDASDAILWTQTGIGAAGSATLAYTLQDGQAYRVLLVVWDADGMASQEVSRDITVSYALPVQPVVDVIFDEDTGSALISVTNSDEWPQADHNVVYRKLDGAWELIATIPPNGTASDATVPLGVPVTYKVETWSDLPSVVEVTSQITPRAPGKVYINGGDGLAEIVVLQYDQAISTQFQRASKVEQYAGRSKPVPYQGVQVTTTLEVSALFADRSYRPSVEAVMQAPGVHLYRDCFGRRMFCVFVDGYTITEGEGGTYVLETSAIEVEGL